MTNSMTTPTIPAIKRSIVVNVGQERAFSVFTASFEKWWPAEHHIGKEPFVAVVLEPKAGGRWYERGASGAECEWGHVLAWEPPRRVVVSWHLNGDFQWVADIDKASEIEVRFIVETPNRTRVELEHRHFERHGASGERLRVGVDAPDGWTLTLTRFAAYIAAPV